MRYVVLFGLIPATLCCTRIQVVTPAVVSGGIIDSSGNYKSRAEPADGTHAQALYIEANDQLDDEALNGIISIAAPIEYENSDHRSAAEISMILYGTKSQSFVRALERLNGTANLAKLDHVKAFAGPRFVKPALAMSSAPREYSGEALLPPETVTYSYVALRTADSKRIASVSAMLNSKKSVDRSTPVNFFSLVPNWRLADNGCTSLASTNSDPYYSLHGWTFPPETPPHDVTVAIVDSGIGLVHDVIAEDPESALTLEPVLVRNDVDDRFYLYTNASFRQRGESHRTTDSECHDDRFGCDMTLKTGAIQDVTPDPDVHGHGTHVAGLASGVGLGPEQVPPKRIRVLFVKVVDGSGLIPAGNANAGLAYALNQQARIINMSMIGRSDYGLNKQFRSAQENNGLVVVAAGNGEDDDGKPLPSSAENSDDNDGPYYPALSSASFDNVISVAATEPDGSKIAVFSDYGASVVTIAAPGVRVPSTLPGKDNTGVRCGTSQAAPIVTLTAALLRMQDPSISARDIKIRVQAASDYREDLSDAVKWGGLLNMEKSLHFREDIIEASDGLHFGMIDKRQAVGITSKGQQVSVAWEKIAKLSFDLPGMPASDADRILLLDQSAAGLTAITGKIQLDHLILREKSGPVSFDRKRLKDVVTRLRTACYVSDCSAGN
jgi:hypothetical protein